MRLLGRVMDGRPSASHHCGKVMEMLNRRSIFLLVSIVVICLIAAGTWYYRSKCHGMDACAAADAESHQRASVIHPLWGELARL
jgi:hypothetical protein